MAEDPIIATVKEKMKKVVQHTISEFETVHAGKASPSMVEGVQVEVYGSMMRIKDIAAITTPDVRTIAIQPWDKGVSKAIEKAILLANLGFTPVVDADRIRCIVPEMSKERRQQMVKMANGMAETGRVSVRTVRREAMDAVKAAEKAGRISEDERKRLEKEVQKVTDDTILEVNQLLEKKEKDLMTV